MRSPDLPSLVGGFTLVAFGVVLETIDLKFGTFAPIAFAAVGAILVALGLSRRA